MHYQVGAQPVRPLQGQAHRRPTEGSARGRDRGREPGHRVRRHDTSDGGCDADTIVRTVSVPFEKIVYHERTKWYHKMYKWSFYLLLLGVGAEGVRRLFRFR